MNTIQERPSGIIDPKLSPRIRFLERRQQFRETLSELLEQLDHMGDYPLLKEDIEYCLGVEYAQHQPHEIPLLVAIESLMFQDAGSLSGSLCQKVHELILVSELNTDDRCEETDELLTEIRDILPDKS